MAIQNALKEKWNVCLSLHWKQLLLRGIKSALMTMAIVA
jgi:hypothetical protein